MIFLLHLCHNLLIRFIEKLHYSTVFIKKISNYLLCFTSHSNLGQIKIIKVTKAN